MDLRRCLISTLMLFGMTWSAFGGADALTDEEIATWLAAGGEKLRTLAEKRAVPIRAAFVTGFDKKELIKFRNVSRQKFESLGMFLLAEPTNFSWSLTINKARAEFSAIKKVELDDTVRYIMGVAGADLVVFAPETAGAPWSIRLDLGSEVKMLQPVQKAPAAQDLQTIYDWLMDSLGYNGIILDQKGEYFLIASKPGILAGEAQAVVLGDSAKKVTVDASEKAGTALLKMLKSSGAFGVFHLVFQKPGTSQTSPGDKVSVSR